MFVKEVNNAAQRKRRGHRRNTAMQNMCREAGAHLALAENKDHI